VNNPFLVGFAYGALAMHLFCALLAYLIFWPWKRRAK